MWPHTKENSLQMLIGICSGIAADGKLNETEFYYLRTWLTEKAGITSRWPANVLVKRIKIILKDGLITDEEREHLLETIQSISGNYFFETGAPAPETPAFPKEFKDHEVRIEGASFCLTGNFFFGRRGPCEEAVKRRGGKCAEGVTNKLDYLVVGSRPSPDWKHGSLGLKIEKAVAINAKGGCIKIVSEDQWALAIERYPVIQ